MKTRHTFPVFQWNCETMSWTRKKQSCHLIFKNNYLFAVEALVENDTEWPHIDFWRDFGRGFANHETFGRQIPIGSGTLRRQVHAMIRIVVVSVHNLGQSKIGDLDVATHGASSQQNVSYRKRKKKSMQIIHQPY